VPELDLLGLKLDPAALQSSVGQGGVVVISYAKPPEALRAEAEDRRERRAIRVEEGDPLSCPQQ